MTENSHADDKNATPSVVVKMRCESLDSSTYAPGRTIHKVNLATRSVAEGGENQDFTGGSPMGTCWVEIEPNRPALKFFEPGKRYHVTFTEAPD